MTTLIAVVGETWVGPVSPLPAVVTHKIAAFLQAGTTGQIVLDVKDGRVLAFKLTEAGRVPAEQVDRNGHRCQDSNH